MNIGSTQRGTTPHPAMQTDSARAAPLPETIQSSAQDTDLDGFVDIYAPTSLDVPPSGDITQDEVELIETEESFKEMISQSTEAGAPEMKAALLPDDPSLNAELKQRADCLDAAPKDFLQFVAKNTNPRRTWFSFKNVLNIIAELISLKKPALVLNRNCVHCAQAVDRTLAHFTSEGHSDEPKLYQVAEGGRGNFQALIALLGGRILPDQDKETFVRTLSDEIGKGSRGCISIPVKNYPFSHAMNVVYMADGHGPYIICGQQNRVYNLRNDADLEHFWNRYELREDSATLIVRTGQAPSVPATTARGMEMRLLGDLV